MRPERVDVGGIELSLIDHGPGEGPVVVLLHGFPELAFSWRHQIEPLASAGYRVLVPDLRGYGDSDAPAEIEAYSVDLLAADVIGILDHVGAPRATLIGHDWGADLAWRTAWIHPERVLAVGGLSVPFMPRASAPPVALMRSRFGEDFYMVWIQEPGVAEAALERDVERSLATPRLWNAAWAADSRERPARPAYLTDHEFAVYVDTYRRTGFRGGLNYYRNIDRNWELTARYHNRRIRQPALFLTGDLDMVRAFMPAQAMDGWVTDLRVNAVIPGAGHWLQQQVPDVVNDHLLAWLANVHEG